VAKLQQTLQDRHSDRHVNVDPTRIEIEERKGTHAADHAADAGDHRYNPTPSRHGRIAVLDIDSTDRGVLKEALHRHGEARVIVQTASGKYHAYYQYGGERRHIRPWGNDLPIDVLGKASNNHGLVYLPPSLFGTGEYVVEQGRIEDLRRLTPIVGLDDIKPIQIENEHPRESGAKKIKLGNRNNWLLRQCLEAAHHCDNLDALIDIARTRNEECGPENGRR
jgi:hypothetical protein